MHAAFGTSPLVQLSNILGLSATATGNVSAIAVQLALAYFGIVTIESLAIFWFDATRRLSFAERLTAIWCCAFAPLVGWRFAAGHENLLQGLLPWLATIALGWSARVKRLSTTSLVIGALAVFNALPSLGQQTLIYSAVFGAPITLVTMLSSWRGRRITRDHLAVVIALLAGVLLAMPRVVDMVHYQFGGDSIRGASRSMFYAYGYPLTTDWLASLPWTTSAAFHWPGAIPAHETNYPLGPLLAIVLLLWPRGSPRTVGLAWLASGLLATTFALDLDPISSALRALPFVDAFRVPARAMMPFVVLVPVVALAVLAARPRQPLDRWQRWSLVIGAGVFVGTCRWAPTGVREVLAWTLCVALACMLRWRWRAVPPVVERAAMLLVAALSVCAFYERVETALPAPPVEGPPHQIRKAVLARAPELAMPLIRVQLRDVTQPFRESTAFAAGLPSLDGVWFPPRRFIELLGGLWDAPLPPTAAEFDLRSRKGFDILTQLYNVRYIATPSGDLTPLAMTNGAAWFAPDVMFADSVPEVVKQFRTAGTNIRELLARTVWVRRSEYVVPIVSNPECERARVHRVTTDSVGQTATIAVASPASCLLVVATNYAQMLRASDGERELAVLPVDVALTGILVPAGATTVVLDALPYVPWWAWLATFGGVIGVATSFVAKTRGERSSRTSDRENGATPSPGDSGPPR
jgi:hypothetical protein